MVHFYLIKFSVQYTVSPSKIHLSNPQVIYLGLVITTPHNAIILDKKKNFIQSFIVPTTNSNSILPKYGQLLTLLDFFFLSSHNYPMRGNLWPSYEPLLAFITKPFCKLQQAILQAPTLHLEDLTQPFYFQVTKKKGYALGILIHQLRPSVVSVAYLSKNRTYYLTMSTLPVCSGCSQTYYMLIKKVNVHVTHYCLLFLQCIPS